MWFHGTEGLWSIAKTRILEDRRALPKEKVDLVREQGMHEENFLCRWLRDDTEGKAEEMKERDRTDEEEEAKSG